MKCFAGVDLLLGEAEAVASGGGLDEG